MKSTLKVKSHSTAWDCIHRYFQGLTKTASTPSFFSIRSYLFKLWYEKHVRRPLVLWQYFYIEQIMYFGVSESRHIINYTSAAVTMATTLITNFIIINQFFKSEFSPLTWLGAFYSPEERRIAKSKLFAFRKMSRLSCLRADTVNPKWAHWHNHLSVWFHFTTTSFVNSIASAPAPPTTQPQSSVIVLSVYLYQRCGDVFLNSELMSCTGRDLNIEWQIRLREASESLSLGFTVTFLIEYFPSNSLKWLVSHLHACSVTRLFNGPMQTLVKLQKIRNSNSSSN